MGGSAEKRSWRSTCSERLLGVVRSDRVEDLDSERLRDFDLEPGLRRDLPGEGDLNREGERDGKRDREPVLVRLDRDLEASRDLDRVRL